MDRGLAELDGVRAAILTRWPELDGDDVDALDGSRAGLVTLLADTPGRDRVSAEEEVAEWLDGEVPADVMTEEAVDNARILAARREMAADEDAYSQDGSSATTIPPSRPSAAPATMTDPRRGRTAGALRRWTAGVARPPCPAPSTWRPTSCRGAATPDRIALAVVLAPGGAERGATAGCSTPSSARRPGCATMASAEGERVLLRLGNTVDFPVAYLGAIAAGHRAGPDLGAADRSARSPPSPARSARPLTDRRAPGSPCPTMPRRVLARGGAAGAATACRRPARAGRSGPARLHRLHLRHLRAAARGRPCAPRDLGARG